MDENDIAQAAIKAMIDKMGEVATEPYRRFQERLWTHRVDKSGEGPKRIQPNYISRKECSQAEEFLRDNKAVAITGIGGSGKTALAQYIVRSFSDSEFRVFTSSLVNRDRITLSDVISDLSLHPEYGSAFREITQSGRVGKAVIGPLLDAIHVSGPYLLFFDDFHLVSDPALVEFTRCLINSGGKTRLILTSRRKLDLFSNPGVACVPLNEGLPLTKAGQLLRKIKPDLRIDSAVLKKIWIKCHRGHPYALVTFATLLSDNVDTNDIEKLLDNLPAFEVEDSAWQQKLWGQLSVNEKKCARAFAILHRPLSAVAVKHLAKLYSFRGWQESHKELVCRYVIYSRKKNDDFTMHDIFRDYCLSQIQKPHILHNKAAEFYLSIPQQSSIEIVECHTPALQHAHYAGWKEKKPKRLLALLRQLSGAEQTVGLWNSALEHWGQYIDLAESLQLAEVSLVARKAMCRIFEQRGDYKNLVTSASKAYDIAMASRQCEDLPIILNYLRHARRGSEQFDLLKNIEAAISICRSENQLLAEGQVYGVMVRVYRDMGCSEEFKYWRDIAAARLAPVMNSHSDDDTKWRALIELARLQRDSFSWEEALTTEYELHRVACSIKDTQRVIQAEIRISDLLYYVGRGDEAVAQHYSSLKKARDSKDEWMCRNCLGQGGRLFNRLGRHEEAKREHVEHLSMAESVNDPGGIGWAHNGIGEVLLSLNDTELVKDAIYHFKVASEFHRAKQDIYFVSVALNNVAKCLLFIDCLEEALSESMAALNLISESLAFDSLLVRPEIEFTLAQIFLKKQDLSGAKEYLQSARKHFTDVNRPDRVAVVDELVACTEELN